jgi:2-phospho-L-lactate guanylyltransferase
MFEDVLFALKGVSALSGIAVVTGDPTIVDIARRVDASIIEEQTNAGHSVAAWSAARIMAGNEVRDMIVLPGDVPLVTPESISEIRKRHRNSPAVTIVPAHDDRGTNCMICSPPDCIPFEFGDGSFARHLDAAKRRGIQAQVIRVPGLALDIDAPSDLQRLLARPCTTRAQAYLRQSGIGARVEGIAAPQPDPRPMGKACYGSEASDRRVGDRTGMKRSLSPSGSTGKT